MTVIHAGWHGCTSATGRAYSNQPHWCEMTWEQDANGQWHYVRRRIRRVVAWDISDPSRPKAELGEWEERNS